MMMDITLFCLVFLYFIITSPYAIPFTFFPKVALDKGLNEGEIGLILGSYSVGQLISSFLFGKIMYLFQKKHLLYMTVLSCGLGTISFGQTDRIDNITVFIIVGLLIRLFNGFMNAAARTIILSLIPVLYPESFSQHVAKTQVAYSLANVVGTMVGGIIYRCSDFEMPFIVLGIMIIGLGVPAVYLIDWNRLIAATQSNQINNNSSNINDDDNNNQPKKTLKYSSFMAYPQFLLTSLLPFINNSIVNFVYTFLQLHLDSFPSGHQYVIPTFVLIEFLFLSGCLLVSNFMTNDVDKRWFITVGLFTMITSLTLIGPVHQFGIPKDITLTILGLAFGFSGLSVIMAPLINEICRIGLIVDKEQGWSYDKQQITDLCSAMYVLVGAFGQFTSAALGGVLIHSFNYSNTCFIYFCLTMTIFVAYMLLGKGYELFIKDDQENGFKELQEEQS